MEYIFSQPEDDNIEVHPKGLGWQIFESLKKFRFNVGQICAHTLVQETNANILEKTIRLAIHLRELLSPVSPEEDAVICLVAGNNFNCAIAWIATLFIGVKVATIDPAMSLADTTHLLKCVNPKLVFVVEKQTGKIERALQELTCKPTVVVYGFAEKHIPFVTLLRGVSEEDVETFEPTPCKSLMDTAVIAFSSGTTGKPKGVCLHHYALVRQSTNVLYYGRVLVFSSLYWITSIISFLRNIFLGLPRIVTKQFQPELFWYTVDSLKVGTVFLPMHQIFQMANIKIPGHLNISSLKVVATGGSRIPDHLLPTVQKAFPTTPVVQGFGMTELSGVLFKCSLTFAEILSRYPNTVGKLACGYTVRICNPLTEETLGPHETGELRVKSKYLFNGYYKTTDSADCYDKDGWFKTGDLMYFDENELFFFVDRVKEMFKFRHVHIQPLVLEEILLKHPAVAKAVVVGIEHGIDGHWPMGVVELKRPRNGDGRHENHEAIANEILAYFNGHVDDAKRLRAGVKIVDAIPVGVSGKAIRREVLAMVQNVS